MQTIQFLQNHAKKEERKDPLLLRTGTYIIPTELAFIPLSSFHRLYLSPQKKAGSLFFMFLFSTCEHMEHKDSSPEY